MGPLTGSEPDLHGWVWQEGRPAEPFGRAFRAVVRAEYDGPLCTLDAAELDVLREAVELLGEVLPDLAGSALGHVHLVAAFPPVGGWRGKASSSQFRLSGVVFLNRTRLTNPWWVAEHLLHEALHQKLYDFRNAHSLYQTSCRDAVKVHSLWNVPRPDKPNLWNTDRVLAAFHVYAQLALLAAVCERMAPRLEKRYGPMDALPRITDSRRALARAH